MGLSRSHYRAQVGQWNYTHPAELCAGPCAFRWHQHRRTDLSELFHTTSRRAEGSRILSNAVHFYVLRSTDVHEHYHPCSGLPYPGFAGDEQPQCKHRPPIYSRDRADDLQSGYFLEGEGYDDVAVLSVNSFVSAEADELPFQIVNTAFLNAAKAAGKTKLIIDVQANGGGTILQGYDLFKQLFPQVDPYGATRFRAHEALDLIGEEVSWYSGQFPRSLDLNASVLNYLSTAYNYRTDIDVNGENFHSWLGKYGPQTFGPGPDNFTNIIRWNLSDVLTPLNSGGIIVSGYQNRSNITTQPFAAEDIIVVTDGYCARSVLDTAIFQCEFIADS